MGFNTPCHIIDLDILNHNLERARDLINKSKCKILVATKGIITQLPVEYARHKLDGVSIGSLYEARIVRNEFKYTQIYSPAYIESQFEDVCKLTNSVIFNSINQFRKYAAIAKKYKCQIGIRINPMYSNTSNHLNNFCKSTSHLGITIDGLDKKILNLVNGIHIHNMCESNADALVKLIDYIDNKIGDDLNKLDWINLGGGEMIGSDDYDLDKAAEAIKYIQDKYNLTVILEPCEGLFVNCGTFKTKVLDIINNGAHKIAIMDMSPICHMQDAVFRDWKRDIVEGDKNNFKGYKYILSGLTCSASDTLGSYIFGKPLKIGDIITFKDTATYNMVKSTMFNGMPLPSVYTKTKLGGHILVREPDYSDYLALNS